MRKIILATHGDFSKGLLNSLQMIVGDMAAGVTTYGLYPGEHAADFADEVLNEVTSKPQTEFVIITDLFGASICNAFTPLSKYENVKLFAGMNLNIVLEILAGYPAPLSRDDINEILKSAREGILFVDINETEIKEEDF